MKMDFREVPIVRGINPVTGRAKGDDTGYRLVPVCPEDAENPDVMVILPESVRGHSVYGLGGIERVCSMYYRNGIGGLKDIYVRKPVANGLEHVNALLKPFGRGLLVVDGFRSAQVQAAMWADLLGRLAGKQPYELNLGELVTLGLKADDTCSYAPVIEDGGFEAFVAGVSEVGGEFIAKTAGELGLTKQEVARYYGIFRCNLGYCVAILNESGNTAHGNGGAVDCFTFDLETGLPCNQGVPFDYPGAPAVIDFFEDEGNLPLLLETLESDADLKQHYTECGDSEVTPETFWRIQRERRMLVGAMEEVGATYFSLGDNCGESWHFNLPNTDGNQEDILPNSGNSCQAILRGTKRLDSDVVEAVWSNAVGHSHVRLLTGGFGD
jgi:hypothetical protein